MVGCLGAEANFLYLNLGLRLARFAFFLRALVHKLAIVENPAHRRITVGGDLNQVESCLLCAAEGILNGHDANVFAVRVDQAYLSHADAVIDAEF